MRITREMLIDLCNQFLKDEIDELAIKSFAWRSISDDEWYWDEDDVLSDVIFDWDNGEICYPINKENMFLWKERLLRNDTLPNP